ncbi:MAG TPA: glutaredoxin [Flavobacteriia bacterium]|jgi:glutaredoxin|nr:glutaredoxin [Flavobacteriia bacterium]
MKIIIYGKKGHAYTVAFKNFLKMAEIAFEYKDLASDKDAQNHSRQLYDGEIKYPTLIVDGEIHKTPTTDKFNKIMKDLKLRG